MQRRARVGSRERNAPEGASARIENAPATADSAEEASLIAFMTAAALPAHESPSTALYAREVIASCSMF